MDKWQNWGVEASIVAYDVYINYPVDHSLSLLKQSSKAESWNVAFQASLAEDVLEEDPSTALDSRVPTFHGYSASGNVTAPFVYVNYGTYADFEDLIEAGIALEGKIAIAKYGGIFRGLKVKRAQELGMVGTLIYSDPGDDGEKTEENGYEQYPKGPARNPSSVQRGSVQFLSVRPGDPYVFPVMVATTLSLIRVTDQPRAILPNRVLPVPLSTTRPLPSLPSPSLMPMLFPSSRPSTAMAPRRPS